LTETSALLTINVKNMTASLIESLPPDMRKAAQETLDILSALVILSKDNYVCARAGWTIEMVFHEGNTQQVRERAWKVADLFCETVGPKNLVYWHGYAPAYFISASAQKQWIEKRQRSLENPKQYAMNFHLASGNPKPPEQWTDNAQEFRLYCRINNHAFTWADESRFPGVGPNMSFIRMHFPASWVANQPPERNVGVLTSRMVELMQPFWCSAGWGIMPNVEEKFGPLGDHQQRLYPFLQRLPGLNAIHQLCLMGHIFNNAMHSVTWLNYISDPLLDKLGGRAHVQEQIKASKYLTAKEIGNCLCILAGNFPWLGDTQKNITLPAYGEAARLLKPIRIPTYGYFYGDFLGNKFVAPPPYGSNDKQAWLLACDAYLSRFDNY
jgi:hypothetical protein